MHPGAPLDPRHPVRRDEGHTRSTCRRVPQGAASNTVAQGSRRFENRAGHRLGIVRTKGPTPSARQRRWWYARQGLLQKWPLASLTTLWEMSDLAKMTEQWEAKLAEPKAFGPNSGRLVGRMMEPIEIFLVLAFMIATISLAAWIILRN